MKLRVLDDTTRLLDETDVDDTCASVLGVRWFLPGGGSSYSPLQKQRLTLGRGDQEHVQFDAAGVSRSHAEVLRQGPSYAIHDRGSLNGTYVNGQRVEHTALSRGDVLRLGEVVGIVVRTSAELAVERWGASMMGGAIFGLGLAELLDKVRRIGPTSLPVVIEGETGSGKECVARALHESSGRTGPFHAVNCAALPAALAEAELFGHRKGAFTGAELAGLGHFRAAEHGTLFLDEIADLPLSVQPKLLRVLQQREVTPLGETRCQPLDVRIVAAVQEPLSELVAQKRLREDLAMRISGIVLHAPPLRQRREDIAELFHAFSTQYSGGRAPAVEPRLLEGISCYAWPGNVRELELVVRQLLALHGHEPTLRRHMLPESIRRASSALPSGVRVRSLARRPSPPDRGRREHDWERLAAELERNGGNIKQAAEVVGISRQRAYRLLGQQPTPGRAAHWDLDPGDEPEHVSSH